MNKPKNKSLIKKDSNYQMMKMISEGKHSYEDIKALTSDETKDQLKVFLVTQAKNELRRVLKLTLWLDQIEDNYMKKVEDAVASDELSLKQYESVLNTITTLLLRSNEVISKVLNDDSLMTILNTTIYTNVSTNNSPEAATIMTQLSNPHSREKVRNILNQIIIKADNYTSVSEDNYIETNEIESEVSEVND